MQETLTPWCKYLYFCASKASQTSKASKASKASNTKVPKFWHLETRLRFLGVRKSGALDDGNSKAPSSCLSGFAFEVDSSVHAKDPYRETEKEAPYICRNEEFSPAAGAFFAILPAHIQQQYLRNKESTETEEEDK